MTKYANSAEGGTSGQTVTTGNSGGTSGDAFTAVTSGLVYSNADSAHGSMGWVAPTTAADASARWAISGSTAAGRLYIKIDSAITSDQGILRFSHTTDTTSANLYITNAGTLRLTHKGGTAWTAGATFPVNQWVRVELYANQGTGASDGVARAAYYIGDSSTPVYDSGNVTGLSLGADVGQFSNARLGKLAASTSPLMRFDDFAVNTGADATGLIGPLTSPLATPVVTVVSSTNPTSVGTANGTARVSWPAVSGAASYSAYLAPGLSPSQGDFVLVANNVTSPYDFTGLSVGAQSLGIRAKA